MSSSLGTLTLDLVARIGGFTGPLDAAARETKKFEKSVEKAGERIGKGFAGAATAAAAALTYMVVKQLEVIGDQDDLAHRLRTTVGSLGTLTRAGELSGVGLDQLTSGAQKLDLALGKAAQGSKTQVEAFERLGLSYKTVAALPIDERISAINQALQNNVPAYERAAVAASLFGAKNVAAFQQLDPETIAEANRQITVLGVKLSDVDSSKVEAAGDAVSIFSLALDGVAKQLTVELSPLLTQLSKDFLDSAEEAGGLGTAVQKTTRTVLEGIGFIVDAGDGVGRVFRIISAEFDGLVASAAGSIIAGVFQTLTLLDKLPGVDLSEQLGSLQANYDKQVIAAQDASARMRAALENPLAGTEFLDYYDKAQKAANDSATASEDAGRQYDMTAEQFAAMTKKREADAKSAAAAAKKIDEQFKSAETDYERRIELINTTTDARKDATEVAKLGFELESGKLTGLSAQQADRLKDLAAELDVLEQLKKANEDVAKAAAFSATLKDSNTTVKQGFELELAGSGSGDKLKERLKQDLAIQQDYNKQAADLQKQLNGGDITQALYDKETELLSEALAERLVLQQDYYNQVDAAQSDWLAGVSSALENYKDTSTDYYQQAADATGSILGDTTNSLSESLQGVATQTITLGEAAVNLGTAISGSVLKAITDVAAQWLITQALQLAGIGAVTTATVASEATKTAAKVTADAVATTSSLTATATTTGAQVAAAGTTLSAWLPAALVASIGSFGAAAVVGGAALIAAFALINGFESGGYTGDGASNAVAGIVHKGEYVFTKKQTQEIGADRLAAIARNGFEDGGFVSAIPVPVREGVTTAATNVKMASTITSAQERRDRAGTKVEVIEDASKAGQTRTRLDDDGITEVQQVFIAQIFGDGPLGEAMQRRYGLRGLGE